MARSKSNAKAKQAETQTAATEQTFPTTAELEAAGFKTKSARIRELGRLGMKTGDIARQETGGLYQHAYNVLHRKPKRPVAEAPKAEATPAE